MLRYIGEPTSFNGKTLIISGTSSSVPTCAIDHIIALNHFKRVAFWQTNNIEPSVGYLPKTVEEGKLGLPAEFYLQGDVLILQFRTTVKFGRGKELNKEISTFVKEHEINEVIIVGTLPEDYAQQLNIDFK